MKQVRGECGVNKPKPRPLHDRVQKLADEFEQFEKNREADALVEQAFSD